MRMTARWIAGILCVLLAIGPVSAAAGEDILFVADLHLGAERDPEILQAIRTAAGDADTLVFLGDNTNNGRTEEHTAFLAFLSEMEKDNDCRLLVLPGNHDLSGSTNPDVFRARYGSYAGESAAFRDADSLSYAVLENGLCLLMLDMNVYDSDKRMTVGSKITQGVLEWTERVLKTLPEGTKVIAMGHHPLLPYAGTDTTEGAQALVKCLKKYGVHVYLCGHRHNNYTLTEDSFRQITIGVPWSYPSWAGLLSTDARCYRVLDLLDPEGETAKALHDAAYSMGASMAAGSLQGTAFENDEEAISWFREAFMAHLDSTLEASRSDLLQAPGCAKWRAADVRSVTKGWILGVLDTGMEDVRLIELD